MIAFCALPRCCLLLPLSHLPFFICSSHAIPLLVVCSFSSYYPFSSRPCRRPTCSRSPIIIRYGENPFLPPPPQLRLIFNPQWPIKFSQLFSFFPFPDYSSKALIFSQMPSLILAIVYQSLTSDSVN